MKKNLISKKGVAVTLAMVMLVAGVGGSSLAYLLDSTDTVTNTFTESNINITLEETGTDTDPNTDGKQLNFKMVPGWEIDKDPKVSVATGSEDCYLFVKIEEDFDSITVNGIPYTFDDFIKYEVADGWATHSYQGKPENIKIIYKIFSSNSENIKGTKYSILGPGVYPENATGNAIEYSWPVDHVFTSPEVTSEMMEAIEDGKEPKLKFTAYAIQLYKGNSASTANDNVFDVKTAWEKASALEQ